jgi:hypothetical protein
MTTKQKVSAPYLPQTDKAFRNAKICMPTWRNFKRVAFQGGLYEAQDVLLELDDVDLICLEPMEGFRLKERYQRRLLWKDVTKRLAFVNPGLRPIRLEREYELFIAVCQNMWDLLYINAIKGWKDSCRTSICWIDEIWAGGVSAYRYWFPMLRKFDHVVLGLSGSVTAVEDAIKRPCHYVPGAVDAIRFSPYPNPPGRVIDLYSIGRKWDGVHQALLNMAAKKDIFYVYDTAVDAGDMQLVDHRQHRNLLANTAKRSRFFMVGPAKMGVPEDTHGQLEVGYRYFEGSAAGAVMIGQAPDCDSFRELFGWPNAVIEIKTDGSDVAEVLSSMSAQPEQLRDISRRNAREALLRHDWVYRWKQILNIARLQPTSAMEAREKRLKQLAKMAGNDIQ